VFHSSFGNFETEEFPVDFKDDACIVIFMHRFSAEFQFSIGRKMKK